MMRNNIAWLILYIAGLMSCSESKQAHWKFKQQIPLGNIAPVGIASDGENIWLSDPDKNRLIKTDLQGKVLKEISNLQRPMHITFAEGQLYVPEYLTDTISVFENDHKTYLPVTSKLNAPAGIAVEGNTIAIADFYNHRVILKEGDKEFAIGKEGYNPGELYYPTDVVIHKDRIYVADAYNNRVQVFDKKGNNLQIIGEKDNINVATGIAITNGQLFVTDFEGNKVLIYNLNGELVQTLIKHFDKPADVIIKNNIAVVINYKGKSLVKFTNKSN